MKRDKNRDKPGQGGILVFLKRDILVLKRDILNLKWEILEVNGIYYVKWEVFF